MSHQILIIEDDPALIRGLTDNFEHSGYTVHHASNGDSACEMALALRPDLILLDIMLPGKNGYQICRELRREGFGIPIVMLTAKSEESDLVRGFDLGADDYVTKPFGIRELLVRCEALLRRSAAEKGGGGSETPFGTFILDQKSHQLRGQGGDPVELSPREYDLLAFFVNHPDRALSRDQIMNAVWGYGSNVTPRTIDRFVTGLRKKIETDPKRPLHITTVREIGYTFRP